MRRSAVIHTDRNTYIAEKGPLMGVRIYDIGALTPVKSCPNCEFRFDASYFLVKGPEPEAPAEASRADVTRQRIIGDVNSIRDIRETTPQIRRQLRAHGIDTNHDLLRSTPEQVATFTKAPTDRVDQWFALADLMRVRGVGPRFAEILFDAGVRSVDDLADQEATALFARIGGSLRTRRMRGRQTTLSSVRRWIRNAQRLAAGRTTRPRSRATQTGTRRRRAGRMRTRVQ